MVAVKYPLQLVFGLICSVGVALAVSPRAAAQDSSLVDIPNVTNPANADLLGLRLYMTASEAATTIQQRFHIAISASPRGCASGNPCMKFETATLTPGKKFVSGIAIQNDQMELDLTFTESYPFDSSHPEYLTEASYRPKLATDSEQQAFTAQVRQKYGPTAPVAMAGYFWCTQGAKGGGFTDIAHSQVTWCVGPTLTFDGASLYLSDKNFLAREQTKVNTSRSSALPSL